MEREKTKKPSSVRSREHLLAQARARFIGRARIRSIVRSPVATTRYQSCRVGEGIGIENFAQRLANKLKTEVLAPDKFVFWWADGHEEIWGCKPGTGPRGWDVDRDDRGHYILFSPDKKK